MTSRGRGWRWVAGAAAGGGVAAWAVLRFGLLKWLGDAGDAVRPVVEGLSWIAGIGGLVVGIAALMVAVRQGRHQVVGAAGSDGLGVSRTVSQGGVLIEGGVSGGSGSGATVGVNFGQVGITPPDPSVPDAGVGRPASGAQAGPTLIAGGVTGAVGTTVGVVQGDLVVNDSVMPLPEMESLSAATGTVRIPFGSGVFVGRSPELERLGAAVAESGGRVVVVHGLGGVGKSTLAARFAQQHADRFSPMWWLTADSSGAIEAGLAGLAAAIAPETAVLPVDQRVELAIRWLATHEGWLLVLDNLTTSTDAAALLERVRTGTVVITSRQGSGWRGVRTVPLDVLSAEEAVDLLGQLVRAEWPDGDLAGTEALCAELGWLPLAVEQAAAYLAQNRITPAAYLDLLARSPARMFTATAVGGDEQRTIARVWHVTLDRLADTPLVGRVLRLLAWWAPEGIPRGFLAGLADEPDVHDALGRLAAYSMITLTGTSASVHRLVQAVTRSPDPEDPHRQPGDIATARDIATDILAYEVADRNAHLPVDWPRYRLVLPHVRALFDHTTPATDTPHTSYLLNEFGRYLEDQGDTATAITYLARATQSYERLYGPNDPKTLTSRHNLATAYDSAGNLARALPLYESTLADREQVLGPKHPHTLANRNDVANGYRAAGKLARALPLYESTLADREQVLGPKHPHTLASRHNLARAKLDSGDLAGAIRLFEATLKDQKKVLGADHPDTLTVSNSLAYAYHLAGDLDRALPLFEATLTDCQRILGLHHPNTLASSNNLASAYRAAGEPGRALSLLEATLADYEQVLGANHPTTQIIRANLDHAKNA